LKKTLSHGPWQLANFVIWQIQAADYHAIIFILEHAPVIRYEAKEKAGSIEDICTYHQK
jgi:hypothetical protein